MNGKDGFPVSTKVRYFQTISFIFAKNFERFCRQFSYDYVENVTIVCKYRIYPEFWSSEFRGFWEPDVLFGCVYYLSDLLAWGPSRWCRRPGPASRPGSPGTLQPKPTNKINQRVVKCMIQCRNDRIRNSNIYTRYKNIKKIQMFSTIKKISEIIL